MAIDMEFPTGLQATIESEAEAEFNNPSPNFGDRLRVLILNETGQQLPNELVFEFDNWDDVWFEGTWRDFVLWVIRKILKWWKSLFE